MIRAVTESGGMLGFSLYPHHLAGGGDCTLRSFCEMIARTAETFGTEHLGIGSDLCQDQPDSVVEWMRVGRWTREIDYGEGSAAVPGFPPMPPWFRDNRDFGNVERGLADVGLDETEVAGLMGGNWYRFYAESFGPPSVPADEAAPTSGTPMTDRQRHRSRSMAYAGGRAGRRDRAGRDGGAREERR